MYIVFAPLAQRRIIYIKEDAEPAPHRMAWLVMHGSVILLSFLHGVHRYLILV